MNKPKQLTSKEGSEAKAHRKKDQPNLQDDSPPAAGGLSAARATGEESRAEAKAQKKDQQSETRAKKKDQQSPPDEPPPAVGGLPSARAAGDCSEKQKKDPQRIDPAANAIVQASTWKSDYDLGSDEDIAELAGLSSAQQDR